MKSLSEYIIEKAIGNIGISFEEFKDIVNSGKGTKPIWQKFGDAFGDTWDVKYKVFLEYLDKMLIQMDDMGVELDDNILKFIYNKFCSTPESLVKKLIGRGMNASVYELGDKVIKIFFNGRVRSDNKRFYEYSQKSNFKYFPKIYRLGKGYAIMEKLKLNTPKIQKYFSIIDKEVPTEYNTTTYYQLLQDGELDWNKLTKEESEVMHWLEDCGKELWKNKILSRGDFGDLCINNVGERADGTIVYFDI